MPFCAQIAAAPGASSSPSRGAISGRLYAFSATNTTSAPATAREVVGHRRMRGEVAARGQHPDAVIGHRGQVRAARDQRDVRAAAGQRRADVRADRPGAEHREPHGCPGSPGCSGSPGWPAAAAGPGPPATNSATRRRWILPVAVRGISSRTWIDTGTLNAASRLPAVLGQLPASRPRPRPPSASPRPRPARRTSRRRPRSRRRPSPPDGTAAPARPRPGEMFSPPRRIISFSRPSR